MRLMRAIALLLLVGLADRFAASALAEGKATPCKGPHALYLVIDKSRSMAADSLLPRTTAALAAFIPELGKQHSLTVIGFDATPFIIVNGMVMDEAGKATAIERLKLLIATGKSNLVPALGLVRQRAAVSTASCKSLVVISDWIISPEPADQTRWITVEVKKLAEQGVSISTIAVGEDADIVPPRIIAKFGNGKFFSHKKPEQIGENLRTILSGRLKD